jgi:tetratricopeptide (TPR) repeat protein
MTKAPSKGSRAKAKVKLPGPAEELGDIFAALTGQLENSKWDPEVDQAQEIAFEAMEAPTRAKRVALARKALVISPLCADAYAVLAMETDDPKEALALQRQAVEAGAKALGEKTFEEDVGMFWALVETRPYMRARQALAADLWEIGERNEAIEHYQDMLRLNPEDNQGNRYALLDALLELGRDGPAAELLKRYKDDDSAAWEWSRALLAFRKHGDKPASRKALAKADETNKHVADYLAGRKALPKQEPDFIGVGDDDEAVAYLFGARGAWHAVEGATAWVATALAKAPGTAVEREREPPTEEDRIDDAVLALLLLGLHHSDRAWKSFDWGAMDRLHAKGLISNPASQAKSVVFSKEGLRLAESLYSKLFGKSETRKS